MRLHRKLRMKWLAAAFAVAAIAAPGAQAQNALGEGGSAAKVELASGGQAGQNALGEGGSAAKVELASGGQAGQVVESSGSGAGARAVRSEDGSNWLSAALAGCALAILGAVGAAMNRRSSRSTARALL